MTARDKPSYREQKPDPREDRLAKALRANLRRRKACDGLRKAAGEGASEPEKPR